MKYHTKTYRVFPGRKRAEENRKASLGLEGNEGLLSLPDIEIYAQDNGILTLSQAQGRVWI